MFPNDNIVVSRKHELLSSGNNASNPLLLRTYLSLTQKTWRLQLTSNLPKTDQKNWKWSSNCGIPVCDGCFTASHFQGPRCPLAAPLGASWRTRRRSSGPRLSRRAFLFYVKL